MRLSQIFSINSSKIDFSRSVLSSELDTLISNYNKSLSNPSLFPTHIQKLHNLASQVRTEREYLGISQSDLDLSKAPLKNAERVLYAIYDNFTPELYFVASREPAAHDFYKLYLISIKDSQPAKYRNFLHEWLKRRNFDTLGIYVLESIKTTKISFKKIARARLLFWRSHEFISLNKLFAPGHASCKPLPVLTQDGPNRYVKFKLRRIRRDYWNVLCFANSNKLKRTAYELINNHTPQHMEYIEDYSTSSGDNKSDNETSIDDETNLASESDNGHKNESESKTETNNSGLVAKSKGFWIVYSKRFKDSIHILSVSDIATILKSFHIYNRDSGEYVVAVLELQKRVSEMDKYSLMDCLWVLSRRLKLNTQKNFFKSLAQHVPNILYSLDALDIVKVLWNLNNAGYRDVNICRNVCLKFMDHIEELNEQDLSAACLAFGRFGYRNMDLYSKIETGISKNCNAEVLFQASWGFHLAAIDVTKLVTERTETLINSLDKIPRWKVQVWKTILNSTNCDIELKRTLDEYL